MLESRHVRQVAGDSWGRFFRPVDAEGTERQSDPTRILEGYHWGKYTSGSWVRGLWLILVPFGLVNAAAFMVPHPRPGSRWHWLYATVQALIRGIGIGVTCTFALASALILVDLVAWQWAADLPWLEAKPSGPVMTVGVLLAGAAVYGLHWLGDQNRLSAFEPYAERSLAAEARPRTGLQRYEFFHVGSKSQPILGRLHLSAGWSVVALIGALTWQTIDNHSTSLKESSFQHVVWASSLILLLAVTAVVVLMGDPEAALECEPPDGLRRALPAVGVGAEILSGCTLIGSAILLGGTDRSALTLDFDHYSQWLATAAGVALVALLVLLVVLGRVTPEPSGVPTPFRRYANGLAAWGATSTGVFLGVGFCGAFVLGLARALDVRAQTELLYRVAYSWGVTMVFMLVVMLVSVAGLRRSAAHLRDLPPHEYQPVTAPGLGAPGGAWPRRIARAMSSARFKWHVAPLILSYAALGLAMTAVTSIEMLGESGTRGARDLYHHLGWFGYLSQRVPPHGEAPWWVQLLTNLGTYSLIGLAGLLFYLGRRSLRAEESRRGANVVWDVISFWPHAAHPFVPPAYSQFAVHDLRRRIDFHLNPPADLVEAGQPRPRRIVLSAHSQGSLLAFATVLWLSEQDRARTSLVTYGSQLQVAYPRGFPGFVDFGLVSTVLTALGGRWINLYRETDPIAGPVLSWDRSRMATTPSEPFPPTSQRVGGPPGLQEDRLWGPTGRRESGHDWRVLDPQPSDPGLQRTSLTALAQHSGFPSTEDYRDAVRTVLRC
jgi:exosortase/archaeosortase